MNPITRIVERLKALPEKVLLHGCVWDGALERGCAIGACLPERVREEWINVGYDGAFADALREVDTPVFGDWAREHGLTPNVVRRIEKINDLDEEETNGARYRRVLKDLTRISEMSGADYLAWSTEGEDEDE